MLEQEAQDPELGGGLAGIAQRVTEGQTRKNGPRRAHLLRDFTGQADGNGGNPRAFNRALNQSHGLITQPSGRG